MRPTQQQLQTQSSSSGSDSSSSSLPIVLGCSAVVLLLLCCVFGKCGVSIESNEHGSHISFGTRKAPQPAAKAVPAPSGSYQGKVNPTDFDAMFAEQ
jgi:hypothetical protein